MREPMEHPAVRRFMDEVLACVQAKEWHADIRAELASHLAERLADGLAMGLDEEQAVHEAIRQMGEPRALGRQFHRVHRPRFDWPLFALILGLIGVGLLAMASVQLAGEGIYDRPLWLQKAWCAGAGLAVMLALAFADYRKLRRWAWPLYAVTVAALWLLAHTGGPVNGRTGYAVLYGHRFDLASMAPCLLIVAACGVLAEGRMDDRRSWQLAGWFVVVPSCLFASLPDLALLATYLLSFLALFVLARPRLWQAAIVCAPLLALPALLLWNLRGGYGHLWQRLFGFLHPHDDPLGAGYMILQAQSAMSSSGWWGHGFGAISHRLPMAEAEMVFAGLVASFGWLAGGLVAAAALAFLLRLFALGRRAGDRYGRLLVGGCWALFAVQFGWNLLMSCGLLPIAGIPLPFVSHGGVQTVMQLAAAGLLLSVCRRREMMPREAGGRQRHR